jgi:glycosyltransferase involved in cell wall biosynthesis
MLNHKKEGFVYQADAPYMLAHYVCEIFEKKDLALQFSRKAREHALLTHDRETNIKRLMEIYNNMIKRHRYCI